MMSIHACRSPSDVYVDGDRLFLRSSRTQRIISLSSAARHPSACCSLFFIPMQLVSLNPVTFFMLRDSRPFPLTHTDKNYPLTFSVQHDTLYFLNLRKLEVSS